MNFPDYIKLVETETKPDARTQKDPRTTPKAIWDTPIRISDTLELHRLRAAAADGDGDAALELLIQYHFHGTVDAEQSELDAWLRTAAHGCYKPFLISLLPYRYFELDLSEEDASEEDRELHPHPRSNETALHMLHVLAEEKDAFACSQLGAMYYWGDGVKQDYSKAERLLRTAADQGDLDRYGLLIDLYLNGRGVEENLPEVVKLLRAKAESCADLDEHLRSLAHTDFAADIPYLKAAADRGKGWCTFNYALALHTIPGFTQSIPSAIKWYRIAAGYGRGSAAFRLAQIWRTGDEVEPSEETAEFWLRTAARLDEVRFDLYRDLLDYAAQGQDRDEFDDRAWDFLDKAAEAGDKEAQRLQGRIFIDPFTSGN